MAKKHIDRAALIATIRELKELSNEQKSDILQLISEQKKYGIVWEDSPEDVEENLRVNIPVLVEDKDKAIISNVVDAPNHILIEGDNLEALTALTYTHEGKIDVIYIDPPYNTGNEDFRYNDSFIDKDDEYRHSKWLSFIKRRLTEGKRLLSQDGIMFISIGTNEVAQLILLCNELFGESNQISIIPRVQKKGNGKGTHFSPAVDYVLAYAKNISNVGPFFSPNTSDFPNIETEGYRAGEYYECTKSLYQGSLDSRPNQRYYIQCPDGSFIIPPGTVYPPQVADASYVKPKNNNDKCWRWSWDSYLKQKHLLVFKEVKKSPLVNEKGEKSKWNVYTKRYQKDAEEKGKVPPNYIDECINSLGTSRLNDLGLDFSFSKPCELMMKLLRYANKSKEIFILDYFAGSGTTLDATMQLNAEDGGHRQCILCTNNENNICEEVTYERNKRVINGYTTPKGVEVEGLHDNSLRYYKIEDVPRDSSTTGLKKLMLASTDLLCIKNDLYEEQSVFGNIKLRKNIARYFDDGKQKMLILYKVDAIESIVEEIKKMPADTFIKVYVFSTNNYAMDADFEEVSDKVFLCALPAAIYNAYRKVLPRKNNVITEEEEV